MGGDASDGFNGGSVGGGGGFGGGSTAVGTPAGSGGMGNGFDNQNDQPSCPAGQSAVWIESNPGDPRGLGHWECQRDPGAGSGGGGGGWDRVGQYAEDDAACKSENGSDWEAVPRSSPESPRQCRRIGGGGGGGDGAGSGGGGGGGGQKTKGGPSVSFIGPTPEELRLQGILADQAQAMGVRAELLFRLGLPAQMQAQQYFQDLLTSESTATAATGPAREQISQLYGGAGLGQGFLRGGQGRAAQADLTAQSASEISRLIAGVQPQAAQMLGQFGQQGTAAGQAGLAQSSAQFSDLLKNLNQNRAFENQFNLDVAALEEGARQFNLSLDQARWLSERNLDLQGRALDLEAERLSQQERLTLEQIRIQQEQFNQQLGFARQQFAWNQSFQNRQLSFQQSATKGGLFGDLFGTLGAALIFSCTRKVKHMVDEPIAAESAHRYVVHAAETARRSFCYTADPTLHRFDNGIIIEEAPRYGYKDQLNLPQIVGDLFAAILVLTRRIEELEKGGR